MMGQRKHEQDQLFLIHSALLKAVPDDHLGASRSPRFLNLSWVHAELATAITPGSVAPRLTRC